MGETRQHKQKVAFKSTRELSNELGGQYLMNFHEASEYHCSHVQVNNLMIVTGGRRNTVRILTPQNVFSHTNPTTQHEVNNELPSSKCSRGTIDSWIK